LRRERLRAESSLAGNDNVELAAAPRSAAASAPDRLRKLSMWLLLASSIGAVALAAGTDVRVDFRGTWFIGLMIGSLLLISRLWWEQHGHQRIADALGAVVTACIGGMTCGAIAMLELRIHFPIADAMLQSWDHGLGVDGIAVVEALRRQGDWIFAIMAPCYNYTIQVFFAGLMALAMLGDRVEAWRGAFCFVGTLLTTCIIAAFFPAKGIAVWAPASLLAELPPNAMRGFWPHFDAFYFGADPVLRVQVIDGVISFPSFHTIVGLMIFTMWRKNIYTRGAAAFFLVFMLLAIFPGGGHYFVDMLAGFAVWAAWFALSLRVERRSHPQMKLVASRAESLNRQPAH
jgi:hypothetical protein